MKRGEHHLSKIDEIILKYGGVVADTLRMPTASLMLLVVVTVVSIAVAIRLARALERALWILRRRRSWGRSFLEASRRQRAARWERFCG